jgi:hypothetical protein
MMRQTRRYRSGCLSYLGWMGWLPNERSHLPQFVADQELHIVWVCTGYVQSCNICDLLA